MEFFSPSILPLHPVLYATVVVLLLCLGTVIVTYVYHHRYSRPRFIVASSQRPQPPVAVSDSRAVRVSRKFWHMLLNLCLHICLTFAVFAGGINQTRLAGVCQAVSARLLPHLL